MKIEIIPIADLHEDPANVRVHPERNLAGIRGSLARFKQQKPIVIDANNVVIDGNGILASARALGWTEVPCVRTDLKGVETTLYAIAANQTALTSAWGESLGPVLQSLQAEIEFDPIEIGFLPAEVDGLLVGSNNAAVNENGDDDEEVIPSLESRFGPFPPSPDLKAPFPYFGGKSRVAPLVWKRFGSVKSYVEPFAGSLAVLLMRPEPFDGPETVNDLDGMISNFWRAVQTDPDQVALHADWPVIENDLHARHVWLVSRKDSLQEHLEGDPDYFDAKVAGWWVWGICCWIGSGWCSSDGPWKIEGGKLVKSSDEGRGVNRKRVNLSSEGQGVNRQLVHLGDEGKGVNRSFGGGTCEERSESLRLMIRQLSDRLRSVRVCCGDWTRVCGGKDGDSLNHMVQKEPCGIFLDPPYADTAGRCPSIYSKEDLQVAHDVRRWAIAHGDDPRLRICLCGYEGEHDMPESWECVEWKAMGGMSSVGDDEDSSGRANTRRERLWFSPHCVR